MKNIILYPVVIFLIDNVSCLPNIRASSETSNSVSNTDAIKKVNSNKFYGSLPYSLLWKIEGSEEIVRSKQSKLMQTFMNTSVSPCDDFYEYACGNWENVNPIPRDNSEHSVFTLLSNNILNELLFVLSEPVPPNHELNAEEKAKLFFTTCIDETAINRRGVYPLLYFIDQLGGWPVLDDNWAAEKFDWIQVAIKISLLGHFCILAVDVEIDLKNSSSYSIYLEETKLGLTNRDDFLKSEHIDRLDAYRNLIITVLRLLDTDPEKAEEVANEIVEFETQLANITIDMQVRIDITEMYKPTTIRDLYVDFPNIDWLTYLTGVIETPLHQNQTIIMTADKYYANLSHFLNNIDPRVLANYMIWRGIQPFLDSLDENFRAAVQIFREALTGQKEILPRWKECIKEVNKDMGMATGAMFVRRYFDEDSKNETIILLGDVKKAFQDVLLSLMWIDEDTKVLARQKANRTKLAVGYPDFILNITQLNELYTDIQISPGKKFENDLSLLKYAAGMRRKRFGKPVDKEMWPSTPAIVNAFFEQLNNRIIIPVGILQPPIFHKHFPKALNYGAIGVFVGHELTHGFDDIGREFDSSGNMIPWWSEEAVKGFNERENCFVEQYGKYSVNGKFISGMITKGENIADNGGIRQAFQVYKKWQSINSKVAETSESMPGLNLTNNQLFFLAFAQTWCNAIRPEAIENRIQTNIHCPGKFRVIGTLANFDEFSDAFHCPVGHRMNPVKKCRLW